MVFGYTCTGAIDIRASTTLIVACLSLCHTVWRTRYHRQRSYGMSQIRQCSSYISNTCAFQRHKICWSTLILAEEILSPLLEHPSRKCSYLWSHVLLNKPSNSQCHTIVQETKMISFDALTTDKGNPINDIMVPHSILSSSPTFHVIDNVTHFRRQRPCLLCHHKMI